MAIPGLLGVLALCAWQGEARAAEAGPVLVLGLLRQGHADAGLRAAVEDRLRHMGGPVREARLRPGELACRDEGCLGRLSADQQVRLFLGGEIQGEGGIYRVKLWTWDAVRHSPVAEREVSCNGCDANERRDAVALAAGEMIEAAQGGRPPAPSQTEGTAPPPAGEKPAARMPVVTVKVEPAPKLERRPYWTPARSVSVGLLSGLTVVAFGLGGLVQGLLGTDPEVIGDMTKQRQTALPPAIFYGTGGVCALGLAIALAIPTPTGRQP